MVGKIKGIIDLINKIILLCIIMALTSCASEGRNELSFHIHSNQNINPNQEGQPSPLVLTIYELTKVDGFKNADFFSLYEHPKNLLQEDLLSDQQYIIFPGKSKDVTLPLKSKATSIGIVAAFRNLRQADWLALLPLNKVTDQTVNISIQPQTVQFSQ